MKHQSLTVHELTAGYVPGMPIIHDITMSVKPGEIVCVVGPNGAGKSTLMKTIVGLLPVEHGTIKLGSTMITGIRPDKLAQVGVAYVPQLDNIFRTMTIEQNLVLAGKRCHGNRQRRVDAMLSLFPMLNDKFRSKAGALSGGQRQCLAIAMALIVEPSLLLLDEPSAGLSPKATEDILSVLREIAHTGVAILMVEQNVKSALKLSDRAYVFADGHKQYEGPALSLLNDPVLGKIYLGKAHAAKPV